MFETSVSQLFASLRTCLTPEGVESLIKLFMPLAYNKARRYTKRHEVKNPDDYISVAYLATVEGIHNAFKYMTHNELSKYVSLYIQGALLKYYREDRVVAITSYVQGRNFRLGYLVKIEVGPLEPEHVSIITANDLLDSLIELLPELLDRQVLMLRLQAHTDKEISALLDIPVRCIRRRRKHIKEVLQNLLEDDEDDPVIDS